MLSLLLPTFTSHFKTSPYLGLGHFQRIFFASFLSFITFSEALAQTPVSDETERLETSSERKKRLGDYYVVDILIFKHRENFALDEKNTEHWPKNIDLSWPERRSYLQNVNAALIYPEVAQDLANIQLPKLNPKKISSELTSKPFTDKNINTLPLLDYRYSALIDQRTKLDQSSRYALLSSFTWLQKIGPEDKATNIVIPSNIIIDEEKQSLTIDVDDIAVAGTVKLSKSRYLHLQADLFSLSLQSDSQEQTSEQSEVEQAEEPQIVADEEVAPVSLGGEVDNALEETISAQLPEAEQHWPNVFFLTAAYDKNYQAYQKHYADFIQQETKDHLAVFEKQANEAPALPLYALSHKHIGQIKTMQQKRRMRSSELHYIDHPSFGLIVYITPLWKVLERF